MYLGHTTHSCLFSAGSVCIALYGCRCYCRRREGKRGRACACGCSIVIGTTEMVHSLGRLFVFRNRTSNGSWYWCIRTCVYIRLYTLKCLDKYDDKLQVYALVWLLSSFCLIRFLFAFYFPFFCSLFLANLSCALFLGQIAFDAGK